jgi:hypothetical protein
MKRHLIIPDTQVRHGHDLRFLDWIGRAIVDYNPTSVIHLGDHYDMHSLNGYSAPGSLELEGARYTADIDAGNEGFDRLTRPLRRRKKKPRLIYLTGNHEQRILRAIAKDPKLDGVIGYKDFRTCGFQRKEFLEIHWEDGIAYSHFFQQMNSSHAVGGSIDSRLNKIGCSFVQGHEQGFKYGNRCYPTGRIYHGLVAGSCYLHDESYKGPQGNGHWRGIVVLNDVRDGTYEIMPLSLDYLRRRYGSKRRATK